MKKRMFIAKTHQRNDGSWFREPFIECFVEVPDEQVQHSGMGNYPALSPADAGTHESIGQDRC